MKILCVEPGPDHSTYDVYNGLTAALGGMGHQVGQFALHNRIGHANKCLQLRWEAAGSPPEHKPGANEVLFHASSEVVQYALYYQVDWVLFVSSGLVHTAVYEMLRRASVPIAIVLTESPYEDERQLTVAPFADVLWTNERASVPVLREVNPNTFYLPHAYDPAVHTPKLESSIELSKASDSADFVKQHQVVFVGTLWQERIDLLAAVDWTGIDLGIYGSADLFDFERYPSAENERSRAILEPYLHVGFVDNSRTSALYRAASIGLNLHRTSVKLGSPEQVLGAESMNPRCYEQAATGGALLVTDARAEVHEVFGSAAWTFKGPGELQTLVRYFLTHEDERQRRVCQLRAAIGPHTFAARAAQVTADLAACRPALVAKGA